MNLCECGCGKETNLNKRFVPGHNSRNKKQTQQHIEKRMKSIHCLYCNELFVASEKSLKKF